MDILSATAFDLTAALRDRGVDLAALGAAYLAALANLGAAMAAFAASRSYLVISPNRSAKDYGIYVSVVLAALAIATVLENELMPRGSIVLQYVALPHLAVLLVIHLWVAQRQEPWLIALAGSSVAGAILVIGAAAAVGAEVRLAHWLAVGLLSGLLVFLWLRSVSTKRGFVKANTIYLASKETLDAVAAPQKPWLGLTQWVALAIASVALAIINALLRGSAIAQIPAVQVLAESALVIAITALVCAVPATSYWLVRKAWMPELTRFVWLVWLVVGFAFTYGNYLNSFGSAI
jgi:hypothetical protein